MTSGKILRNSELVCRRLARSHYENFLVASILLPRRLRQPFYNIYAFCRTADDLADQSPSPEAALTALDDLQSDLDATFAGHPPDTSFFPALAHTVETFDLAKKPFEDLLSAFRQDQHVTQYASMPELIDYCTRSANPVGRIVLQLAGQLNEQTAPLSDQICTGLQLANFWQDVKRDWEIGRVYLPQDACRRHGVQPRDLADSRTPETLKSLLAQLCDDAEAHFHRGLPLAEHVPRWLAGDIRLFAHGGLATLQAIRKIDFDVLRVRPKVTKMVQLKLMTRAATGRL
ncbi:squalene synthase HpnC [Roseiconus nitratireducens]|uniref:Squalene synthase HpnC n=1 Tax=Roseiconus nitratireducens TaxID=2605748 RepID=A0A5M6DAC2_9BACT|nr:squalene synthase HpnC [Roseiconus nitratireducens]KAA5544508.1 squalene synthase HpnC [Roseiconus nitratireducens]